MPGSSVEKGSRQILQASSKASSKAPEDDPAVKEMEEEEEAAKFAIESENVERRETK